MTSTPLHIGIAGACGRMGQLLCQQVTLAQDMSLSAGLVSVKHKDLDLGKGVFVTTHPDEFTKNFDHLIDFSTPAATLRLLTYLNGQPKPVVVGTTGLTDAHRSAASKLSKTAPVILAPNTCLTVTLLMELTKKAASCLGDDFDIEIQETHHRHKIDAPSGTALALGQAAALGRGGDLNDKLVLSHQGVRIPGTIGIVATRGGEIAGQHTIHFHGPGESLSLSDQVYDRSVFAKGALTAMRWLAVQKPGLYTMKDVLGL